MTLRVFSAAGLVLCLAAASCSGAAETIPAPPASCGCRANTANDFQSALARLPDVKAEIVSEGGSSITSLLDLKNGKTNVSGTLADVAYLAYAGQLEEMTEPFDQLRGMAVTGLNTMHLLVGRDCARGDASRPQRVARLARRARQLDRAHHAAHASGFRNRARTDSRRAHPEHRAS